MAPSKLVLPLVLAAAAAASPLAAAAPPGSADTRYCMKLAPTTGTLVERVRCWTREQWSAQGVDVDRDWDREGVRTIG